MGCLVMMAAAIYLNVVAIRCCIFFTVIFIVLYFYSFLPLLFLYLIYCVDNELSVVPLSRQDPCHLFCQPKNVLDFHPPALLHHWKHHWSLLDHQLEQHTGARHRAARRQTQRGRPRHSMQRHSCRRKLVHWSTCPQRPLYGALCLPTLAQPAVDCVLSAYQRQSMNRIPAPAWWGQPLSARLRSSEGTANKVPPYQRFLLRDPALRVRNAHGIGAGRNGIVFFFCFAVWHLVRHHDWLKTHLERLHQILFCRVSLCCLGWLKAGCDETETTVTLCAMTWFIHDLRRYI